MEHAGALAAGLRRWLGAVGRAGLDLLYPDACPACGDRPGPRRLAPLCERCWATIERLPPPWCARCGRPLGVAAAACGACALAPPPWDWARSAARFAGPLRDAVHALKFAGRRTLAGPLGDLVLALGAHVPWAGIDALVPVPLAPARRRERGYDQALLLARHIGRGGRCLVDAAALRRVRATLPQSELSGAERAANVRGAFVAGPGVAGRAVVLVDDVLTTGATAAECARALRRAGARSVGVLTVARVA